MIPIEFQEKDKSHIQFTFAKEEIRVKSSNSFFEEQNDKLTAFVRLIEPLIYGDFQATLRGKIHARRFKELALDDFKFTLRNCNKFPTKTISVRGNIVEIIGIRNEN